MLVFRMAVFQRALVGFTIIYMVKNASMLIRQHLLLHVVVMPPAKFFPGGIVGIDEAGRGPLAGPVIVGAVRWLGTRGAYRAFFRGIRDSKKLSPRARSAWYARIVRHPCVRWGVGAASSRVVDRIRISRAANRAALDAYRKVARTDTMPALLDYGLFLHGPIVQQAIIKGDEKIALLAAASIIAKVTRDRIMVRLHAKFPQWAFDVHKGYGTALHRTRIQEHGLSPLHRKSFCTRMI